jgi:hypothetical protein
MFHLQPVLLFIGLLWLIISQFTLLLLLFSIHFRWRLQQLYESG